MNTSYEGRGINTLPVVHHWLSRLRQFRIVRWTGSGVAALLIVTGLIGIPSVPDDLASWGPIVEAIGDWLQQAQQAVAPFAADIGRWIAVGVGIALLFALNYRAGRVQAKPYPVSIADESRRREARDRAEAVLEERWQREEQETSAGPRPAEPTMPAAVREPATQASGEATRLEGIEWCGRHRPHAIDGLRAAGKSDYVEVCATVRPPVEVTQQRRLLDAVRENNIDTFGWPIGIVIESRADSRPRPTHDGVVVSFSWDERGTYDYWAMSVHGEFFTLTNLSEDVLGRPDALSFNTRIVRTAETIMFLTATYRALGAADDARVSLAIRHVGLDRRVLSAVGNRRHSLTHDRTTTEPEAVTTTTFTLREADESLVEIVKGLLSPLFHLYEFCEFADEVYEDIVTKFAEGQVT